MQGDHAEMIGRRLVGARRAVPLLKFFIQIGWEVKVLDHKKFAAISVPLNEIGKMVGGWKKSLE